MPNYVNNTIKLMGSDKDVNAITELLRNKSTNPELKNEAIDFNNVISMPQSLNLVAGGHDRDYVAVYINTLSDEEKSVLSDKLSKVPTSFYGNYYRKYGDSFNLSMKEIPLDVLTRMADEFKEKYESINPASIEEVGKTYIDNILNFGADTWYDWCRYNWGTKWGAMNSAVEGNTISFNTAWSSSVPITERLSEMFPNVVFAHEWADEDIGSNCGRYVLKGGEILEEYLPEGDEAVAFACNMWGYDEEEYGSSDQCFVSLDDVIASCKEISEASQGSDIKKEPELDR